MEILSDKECDRWLASRGFDYESPSRPEGKEGFIYLPDGGFGHEFQIPTEAGQQLLLTHRLARWPYGSDVLLWFTSWAVYTESQMDLFRQSRHLRGEERRLIDAPGYRLDMTDAGDVWIAAQLLLFMTSFNWEGFVLQGDRRSIIGMADEVIETYTLDGAKETEMQSVMEELFLNALQREP